MRTRGDDARLPYRPVLVKGEVIRCVIVDGVCIIDSRETGESGICNIVEA